MRRIPANIIDRQDAGQLVHCFCFRFHRESFLSKASAGWLPADAPNGVPTLCAGTETITMALGVAKSRRKKLDESSAAANGNIHRYTEKM